MEDYDYQYEQELVESLLKVIESDGPKNFTNLIMGLGVVKILESIINHIRNKNKHFFCFSYYLHLIILILLSCQNIFLSDYQWEDDWLEIHFYYFIDSFILIFLIYFSVPSEQKMNDYFLSLKDFYKENMKVWVPLYLLYYIFVDYAVWIDRSITCDPEYYNYCYNYTWLETISISMWTYPLCAAILMFTKNVWFALFFYWYTNIFNPFLHVIVKWIDYWIFFAVGRGG